jgi:dihydroorotase
MYKLLIRRGKVANLEKGTIEQNDILIAEGKIVEIAPNIEIDQCDGIQVIEAEGKLVSPGLIDLHVHLREPGFEYKETIATGTKAAARGGFTTIACMPNTRPVIDSVEKLEWLRAVIEKDALVRVLPIAAITKGELGRELTDMAALKDAGAFAFSDDGVGVQESRMMRDAMQKAKKLNMSIVAHCEDESLAKGGSVHEGLFAAKYGLKGIPNEAEAIHVARDILLAESTGVHYHVCHISAEQSVHHVREGKRRGVRVTAEVTPHHLLLCDEDIPGLNPNYKMNPPLRSRKDREALIEGLKDGTIDFIATDHAPHASIEKAKGMELAPFGIVGLETAFSLLYTHLVETGIITLVELLQKMSFNPAKAFHLPWGRIEVGLDGDLTIIDLDLEKSINPTSFASKGKNTPFAGWKCKGWPIMTIVGGKVVWQDEREKGE